MENKICNERLKFWSKKKNKWFLPNVIFLPFLYPYISAGLDSVSAEAKHSPAEQDRTGWRKCMETVCSAQKCSLDKALECCHSPWRKGNSGILKTGSWWEEDHRKKDHAPIPLHEQGHLEPIATYSHSNTCLTFCHNLWSSWFSAMFYDYWKKSESKRPHFRADWIVEMSQECLSLTLWNSPWHIWVLLVVCIIGMCWGTHLVRVSWGAAGVELQVELWRSRSFSPRQEAVNCRPFAQPRARGPVAQPGEAHGRRWWDQIFPLLDCEGIKTQRFLCLGCLLGGTSSR